MGSAIVPKTQIEDKKTGARATDSTETRLAFCKDDSYYQWEVKLYADEDDNDSVSKFFDAKTSMQMQNMVPVSYPHFSTESIGPGSMWAVKKRENDGNVTLVSGPSHNVDNHFGRHKEESSKMETIHQKRQTLQNLNRQVRSHTLNDTVNNTGAAIEKSKHLIAQVSESKLVKMKDESGKEKEVMLLEIVQPNRDPAATNKIKTPKDELREHLQMLETEHKINAVELRAPEFLKDLGFLNTILSNCGIDKPGDRLRIIKHLIDGDCTTLE